MKATFQKGFTLMELLIVMVILGILTTIVAGNFTSSQERARDTRRKGDLEALADALEIYYNDKGRYPDVDANGGMVGCGAGDAQPCNWGAEFSDQNSTIYMAKIPQENSTSRQYYYDTSGTFQWFALYTRLENDEDRDIPKDAGENNQYYDNTNCGPGFPGCNFAVTSTNVNPDDNSHTLITE